MSKAVQITITKRIMNFLSKGKIEIEQIPTVGFNEIPSTTNFNIPSLMTLSAGGLYPDVYKKPLYSSNRPKKSFHQLELPFEILNEEKDFIESNLHLEIISLLKENGYSVEEVKELPSGERLISVSDVIGESNQDSYYEFAYRRYNEQNLY